MTDNVAAPSARAGRELRYMPQLDALRAFAVTAVLVQHYLPGSAFPRVLVSIPWGTWGVHLFFVLSGFLITTILLRARTAAEGSSGDRWRALRQFYARRILRIFPLYYAVVAVALLLDLGTAREIAGWLLTHTLNILMTEQNYYEEYFAHFWSLNVEEHFYLVWPWVVLFAPRRWLLVTLASCLVLSPAFRLYEYQQESLGVYIATPGNLDTLSLGAILALAHASPRWRPRVGRLLGRYGLPVGLVMTLWLLARSTGEDDAVATVLSHAAFGLVFCWLVSAASRGVSGPVGAVLTWRPLVNLGKISYGVYVYHLFTPYLTEPGLAWLGIPKPGPWTAFLASSVATIAIATVSWHLLERPIVGWKRFFPYRPPAAITSSDRTPSPAPADGRAAGEPPGVPLPAQQLGEAG